MPCGVCLVGVLSQTYADFRALVAGAGGALVASVIRVPQVRGAAPLFLHACVRSCARACVHARCKALCGCAGSRCAQSGATACSCLSVYGAASMGASLFSIWSQGKWDVLGLPPARPARTGTLVLAHWAQAVSRSGGCTGWGRLSFMSEHGCRRVRAFGLGPSKYCGEPHRVRQMKGEGGASK